MPNTLAGLNILVVEDDWLLADLIGDLIELHGGSVVGPASSEQSALDLLDGLMDGATADAAVLDVALADGSCYSLAEVLTERDVPVILMTGYNIMEIPEVFSQLPTFSKPFRLETLIERIAEQCGG